MALLTEGVSEYRAMPLLLPQIRASSRHDIVDVMKINVAPDAPPPVIARECKSRLLIAAANGCDASIVLLDREQQGDCAGLLADEISRAIARACPVVPVHVVLKDRAFENWLIADPDALHAQPGRFRVNAAFRRAVVPNKADRAPALSLLKQAVRGEYEKVADSARICRRMDVARAAANSRSFRHLLHVLEHEHYPAQCRRPHAT